MKTTFLTVLIILAIYLAAYATGEYFVYDSKGNRDPFVPLVTKEGIYVGRWQTKDIRETIVLEGIVWDPQGESLAIVNGTIVKEGDNFLNFKIIEIEKGGIKLLKGDVELTINLIIKEK